MTFKGEVAWTHQTTAKAGKNDHFFDIETKGRNYCLECKEGTAQVWVAKINTLLHRTVKGIGS